VRITRARRVALWCLGLVGLAIALALPWVLESFSLGRVSAVLQLSIAVLSMNLLVGLNGQLSIGQAAFVGLGAYACALLMNAGWPFFAALVVASLLAALAGLIVGLPSLRLRGLYVALTSLGIAIVFPTVIQATQSFTGGTAGLGLTDLVAAPNGLDLNPDQWIYFITLAVAAVVFFLVRNLKHSRMGRALQALRDHQEVAEAFGVHAATAKVLCFAISAGIAGASGCLFALQRQYVSPADFSLTASIDLFVGMAVGGATSVFGALIGGGFLQYAPVLIEDTGIESIFTPLVYGLVLILSMIFFRKGVTGAFSSLWRRVEGGGSRRSLTDVAPRQEIGTDGERPEGEDAHALVSGNPTGVPDVSKTQRPKLQP
jgi:branched-chain amino acid transport system permease protein